MIFRDIWRCFHFLNGFFLTALQKNTHAFLHIFKIISYLCKYLLNMSLTSDSDVDSGASLLSSLTPVLSTVCWISRLDGTDRRCCCLPGADTHTDFSFYPPHDSQSSRGVETLTVKRDGAVFKELQSGWNDPSKSCIWDTEVYIKRFNYELVIFWLYFDLSTKKDELLW